MIACSSKCLISPGWLASIAKGDSIINTTLLTLLTVKTITSVPSIPSQMCTACPVYAWFVLLILVADSLLLHES